ncbi:hypothetical protein EQV97_14100 [Pseudomonas sp. TMW22090]|uniref:hypothetical protein n=1 Tax=Pseudomonas sp. TMW22090 TaxID=2506434 RepID=UPI001F0FE663|nr:hypothetical protein [Pseudomonas sp. TMW22090]MCH4878517.1 hypothetical protein [Pseudomonas sp. TMW22090]
MDWSAMLGWIEAHPGLASWVQAFGSIASIWAAFLIGNKQIRKQIQVRKENDRTRAKAFYAVIQNAAHNAMAFGKHLESNNSWPVIEESWKVLFSQIINMSKNSLSQIPAHELGRYELVDSFLGVTGSIHTIAFVVERAFTASAFQEHEFACMRMEVLTQCRVCELSWQRFEEISKQ